LENSTYTRIDVSFFFFKISNDALVRTIEYFFIYEKENRRIHKRLLLDYFEREKLRMVAVLLKMGSKDKYY
jgi:hypothetical protein